MANSDKNILITPSVGLSTNPTIIFNGANNTPTTLRVLDDGTVSFEGTAGQLFSISDGLTGSIFSVNDISGIPSIEVLDTGLVKVNQYIGSTVFGASAAIQNSSSVNAKVSISTVSASTPGLIIKAVSSQTANLQEWQNSAGTVLSKINSNGALIIDTANTTSSGLIVKGVTGQTANVVEFWQDPTTVALRIQQGLYPVFINNLTVGSNVFSNYQVVGGIIAGNLGDVLHQFNSWNSTWVTLGVRGAASQTADLQQWQNSAGTVLAKVDSNGYALTSKVSLLGTNPSIDDNAGAAPYIVFRSTGIEVNTRATTKIGLIVKGVASQSADLQQWQNSSGTVLTRVDQNGTLNTTSDYRVANGIISYGYSGTYTARIGVVTGSPTNEATLIIKKKDSGETGNFTEWQNSAGTVLASISAAGNLTVQDLTVNGTTTTINSTTLTVDDKNIELASVASPTDTTADGAGITIKGATDKTFNWVQSTGAFTSSEPISAPGISITGNSVSSNITLVSGYRYFVDTSAARTLTLPASPSLGDEIQIFDASNLAGTNNITVDSNNAKIEGVIEQYSIDVNGAAVTMIYTGSTFGWKVRI